MSNVANPGNSKSTAAHEVIIELIRAGKIPYRSPETTAKEINELYEKLLDGYTQAHNR